MILRINKRSITVVTDSLFHPLDFPPVVERLPATKMVRNFVITVYFHFTQRGTNSLVSFTNPCQLESLFFSSCLLSSFLLVSLFQFLLFFPFSITEMLGRKSKFLALEMESCASSIPPSSSVSVLTQVWEEKQRISLSRERKAARVLGIVMGEYSVYTFTVPILSFQLHHFLLFISLLANTRFAFYLLVDNIKVPDGCERKVHTKGIHFHQSRKGTSFTCNSFSL